MSTDQNNRAAFLRRFHVHHARPGAVALGLALLFAVAASTAHGVVRTPAVPGFQPTRACKPADGVPWVAPPASGARSEGLSARFAAFQAEYGPGWDFRVDPLTGGIRFASGPGGPSPRPNDIGNRLSAYKSASDVNLVWGNAPVDPTHAAALSYDVYRSEAETGPYAARVPDIPQGATQTSTADVGAIPGEPANRGFYLYRIVSKNVAGTSPIP